jgi:predicted metal-dependent hydrolase
MNLRPGVELFNQGLFWEAHEAWEEVWMDLDDDPRVFVQGLIQIAAGYYKAFGQNQPSGCVTLLRRGLEKVSSCPPDFLGVQTGELIPAVRVSLAEAEAWLAGGPGVRRSGVPLLVLLGP